MLIGKVVGNAVSTHKAQSLGGVKMLIVIPIDMNTMQKKNDYVICVDDVGAGHGDIVMCAYGSSARQTDTTKNIASDYSIYAIADSIYIKDSKVYSIKEG